MLTIRWVPHNLNIDFLKWRHVAVALSMVLSVLSIVLVFPQVRGLNFGIDFRGGILVEVGMKGPVDILALRRTMDGLNMGQAGVQAFGKPTDAMIRVEHQQGGVAEQQQAVEKIKTAVTRDFPGVEFRRVETVGPKVSGELAIMGFVAVGLAVLAIMIYVWFRFEWQFGVGAVVSTFHNATMTIGLFAVTGIEFDLTTIAAVLTVVGYSVNDTVVVFDRIRENLRKYKKMELVDVINLSVNETLSRTTLTSFCTAMPLFALLAFGGEVIRGFTLATLWGIFVCTYSSIYIAAPFLIWFKYSRQATASTGAASAAKL